MRHGQYATLNGRKGLILERGARGPTKWHFYHPWFSGKSFKLKLWRLRIHGKVDRHKDVLHVDGPYWIYFLDPGKKRVHYNIWWEHRSRYIVLFERSPGLGMPNTSSEKLNRLIFWLWDKFGKKFEPPLHKEMPLIHLLDEFVPDEELYDNPNSTTTFPYLLYEKQ